jgi:hypothetical protein
MTIDTKTKIDDLQNILRQRLDDYSLTLQFSDSPTTGHFIFFVNSDMNNYRVCVQVLKYELAVTKVNMWEYCAQTIQRSIEMRLKERNANIRNKM